MFGFGGIQRRRDRAARSARGALADYYRVPAPVPATPASGLRLLAIDAETTGLDPSRDALLSLGWVAVEGHTVVLGASDSLLVRGADVGQSATVHGLTDDRVAAGLEPRDALDRALAALAGRVLLAHHAVIEVDFLSRLCEEHYGAPLVPPVVDTMLLQRRLVASGFDQEPRADDLRLWRARQRYGLPRYTAHEALTDALACAELYLAQIADLGGEPTLSSLSS